MKDLVEFYSFMKGKSNDEIIALIEKDAQELVKKYGSSADLHFKGRIRDITNLLGIAKWYFKDKLPNQLNQKVEKNKKDTLMNVKEVAKELGVVEVTIYTYIKNGTLKPVILGQKGKRNIYRFERSEVERVKNG